jgi:hypothetical protein
MLEACAGIFGRGQLLFYLWRWGEGCGCDGPDRAPQKARAPGHRYGGGGPSAQFGSLQFGSSDADEGLQEKLQGDGTWIYGGYFVLEPQVIDRIEGDATLWEQDSLRGLAAENQLMSYHHHVCWQPMDTLRDRHLLEELWTGGQAPWKVW